MAWMGMRDEVAAVAWSVIPHSGNSHREKYLLYALVASVVLLIVLRALGLATFDDPLVRRFVEFGFELLKMGVAFVYGGIHKSERIQRRNAKGAA